MFLPRCFWKILTFAALSAIVLTGCHQIPSSRSNWGGGVGEYMVEDDEIRDQWRKAAAGSDSDGIDAPASARSSENGPSGEERFSFVKRFFTKSDDAVSKKPVDQKRPDRLADDERFFPADHYSTPATAFKTPTFGKIVPIPKTGPQLAAESGAGRPSEPASEIASIQPLIESIHSRAEERQPSNAVFLFPEYGALVNNSPQGQSVSTDRIGIKPVTFFEKKASFESGAQSDRIGAESQTGAVPFSEQAKLSDETNIAAIAATTDSGQTDRARKMIQASPLAFLCEPAPAIKPVLYELSQNGPAGDWRAEARRAAERLRDEIDRRCASGELRPAEVARLRLLLVATGDDPAAIGKIAATKPELAEFWEQQCRGLETVIASQENGSNESLQAAAGELTDSLHTLKTVCPVTIQKALFAEASAPFGLYRPHSGSYQPGATAFVYLELDNIVSKKTKTGYELAVLCRWELLDAQGKPVGERREQLCSNCSASPLKDVVLNIPAELSENLTAGDYAMRIIVQDQNAAQSHEAQSDLALTIQR